MGPGDFVSRGAGPERGRRWAESRRCIRRFRGRFSQIGVGEKRLRFDRGWDFNGRRWGSGMGVWGRDMDQLGSDPVARSGRKL